MIKEGKPKSELRLAYVGGANTLPVERSASRNVAPLVGVQLFDDGVQMCTLRATGFFSNPEPVPRIFMPFSNLAPVEIKTEEQITRDVTLARLLMFGIFAFGLKKTRRETNTFMVLRGHDDTGLEQSFVFLVEPKAASQQAAQINGALQAYLKEHPRALHGAQAAPSIPVQIEELARLRDKGLITTEEFETKKKELLSKI